MRLQALLTLAIVACVLLATLDAKSLGKHKKKDSHKSHKKHKVHKKEETGR